MPRTIGTAKESEFDIRITPSDQVPITLEEFKKVFEHTIEAVICEEGEPNGEPKLHYHGYIKCNISETKMSKICSDLGRATKDKKGNAIFSVRKAHAQTIGYIIKCNNISYSNQDQTRLEKYFEISKDYRAKKEADKKAASRSSKKSLDDIMKEMVVTTTTSPTQLVGWILHEYAQLDKPFPPKSQIESAVMKKLYKDQKDYVVAYYSRNLEYGNTR